jgi:PPK2 family polyphosphate:nucleotide phosphotransferase
MSKNATPVRELLLARPGPGALLPGIDPESTPGVKDRKVADRDAEEMASALASLQERLWAEHRRSVLLVLQGMDTSGKDGTVKHVFRGLNPVSVDVVSFQRPTEEERRHHFLWRVENHLPTPGQIVIFNRSHYEDVIAVPVQHLEPDEAWQPRFEEINEFERKVADSGTSILKMFLHISYDEQRKRLLARLEDPDKHWKFDEQDIEQRAKWTEYQAAYETAISRCSSEDAPWLVIPADRKWYRNWAVARALFETLDDLDPKYPRPHLDVAALQARLAPPN